MKQKMTRSETTHRCATCGGDERHLCRRCREKLAGQARRLTGLHGAPLGM